ncbi:MAG: hypothetical protein IT441_07200 [Phycisphaeraceae bacterium]|nr:hypothetical protein [Phycisphaeraceae bacterium]
MIKQTLLGLSALLVTLTVVSSAYAIGCNSNVQADSVVTYYKGYPCVFGITLYVDEYSHYALFNSGYDLGCSGTVKFYYPSGSNIDGSWRGSSSPYNRQWNIPKSWAVTMLCKNPAAPCGNNWWCWQQGFYAPSCCYSV